jgi:hypothetical protein
MARIQRVKSGTDAIVESATNAPDSRKQHSKRRKRCKQMARVQTVEQYISRMDDGKLQDILEELTQNIVPATGSSHEMVRHINRLIDKGEMQINPTTYRHINLPSLIKFVYKEASRRYLWALKHFGRQFEVNEAVEQLSFLK